MPYWVYLDRDENNIAINKYFVDNPEMILGKMEIVSTAYGYVSTCKAEENTNLEEQLNYAITNIHGELQNNSIENEIEQEDTSIPAIPTVKNYSYAVIDDKCYFREVRILCLVLFIFLLFYDTMQKNQGGYKC